MPLLQRAAPARSAAGARGSGARAATPSRGAARTPAERILELQRDAGNAAVAGMLAVQRAADPYSARLEEQAAGVAELLEGLRSVDEASTPDEPTTDRIDAAFRRLAPLSIQNMLDVLALVRRREGLLDLAAMLLPKSRLGPAERDRVGAAIDAVARTKGTGDASGLPQSQQDVLASFGPAKRGTSGEDPEGNTYVVYDGYLKTYFMSGVDKSRRSSVWLANNPGNSDQLGGMGIGGMKWGKHTFAVFPTMAEGRAALWKTMQTRDTLGSYLSYHLGRQADGTYPEGNDPAAYLKHIKEKAPWAEMNTTMASVAERGKSGELLDGFMLAEGITPGKTLYAATASVTASMSPAQQRTMQFYLRLLGVRAAAE